MKFGLSGIISLVSNFSSFLVDKCRHRKSSLFIQAFKCICTTWAQEVDFDSLISFLAKIFSDHLLYSSYGLHTFYYIYCRKPFIRLIFSFPKYPSKSKCKSFSRVRLFETPQTVARQTPLSMGFSRQERWSGLPCPSLGYLPDLENKPRSPTLKADSLPPEPPGKSLQNPSQVLFSNFYPRVPLKSFNFH